MMINLLNLFFPKVCEACSNYLSDNELAICTDCRHHLPVTNFHLKGDPSVKKILYGRVQLEEATALFYFSKGGRVQKLLHNLKYRGHEQIGQLLGQWLGDELASSPGYKTIDAVVPVPLHKKKLRRRGYNQVAKFAQAIASALDATYEDSLLLKQVATKTQVFKGRLGRYNEDQAQFVLNPNYQAQHKHLLLVDDIITTGATIERCVTALNPLKDLKISVATMAIAE